MNEFGLLLKEERQRLLLQRAELQRSFDEIVEASNATALDDEHDPDGSTVAFERAQVSALLDQAHRQLTALDEAERRMQVGTYGQCDRCGQPIDTDRLRALPLTSHCFSCGTTGL